ncbi:MAG: hypothetical protein LBH56_05665 [Coriobacteriales bacterium]|nr:hypothetical protein [Coriobacteriales bacterium]
MVGPVCHNNSYNRRSRNNGSYNNGRNGSSNGNPGSRGPTLIARSAQGLEAVCCTYS